MISKNLQAFLTGLLLSGFFVLPLSVVEAQTSDVLSITPLELSDDPTGLIVALPQGKARIIRLPVDARDVLVANPAVADIVIKTPRTAYLLGRRVGSTNAFFFDEDGDEIARLEIKVELDVIAVQDAMEKLIPNAHVEIKAVNSSLFLTGSVRSNDLAEKVLQVAARFVDNESDIINLMSVIEDQQVLLKVRVAEVSRGVLKNLGIDVAGTLDTGDLTAAFATSNLLLPIGQTTPTFSGFGAATGTQTGDHGSLSLAIEALESNGLIRTLAEPSLTAISGETANFLAGGEIPIPVPQEDGVITIVFRQFGVGVNFTPVVLDSGRISLRVSTEVSSLDSSIQVLGIPGFKVRRAESTVELPSGGSLVIAGLLENEIQNTIEGLPWLKDLPILGPFFRTTSTDHSERELVVTVTAYLVKPVVHDKLLLPTKDIAPPTDYELFFLGRLEAIYGDQQDSGDVTTALKGPIGYIVQ